jgi:hypothetical protein
MPLMTMSASVVTVLHYRGCTRSPGVVIILERPNTHCTDEHPYTLLRCVLGNHYEIVQWLYLDCNVPTEVSPPVLASHPPRIPLLCLMGSSCHSCTQTTPRFNLRSFTEYPSGSAIAASPHHRLVRQDWTLPHTMPSRTHIGSWLYYFHGRSLHEPVLRFRYDNQPQASSITPDKSPEPSVSHRHVPNPVATNPILHTSRIQIFIIVPGVT